MTQRQIQLKEQSESPYDKWTGSNVVITSIKGSRFKGLVVASSPSRIDLKDHFSDTNFFINSSDLLSIKYDRTSPFRLEAQRIVRSSWPDYQSFMRSYYNNLKESALLYKKKADSTFIVLSDSNDKEMRLRSRNRLSADYGYRLSGRLETLYGMTDLLSKGLLFIVLTAQPESYNCLKSMYDTQRKRLHNVETFILRNYPGSNFLATMETHKTGVVHINLLIFGVSWLKEEHLESLKRDIWGLGNGWGVEIQKSKRGQSNQERFMRYVSKYITKRHSGLTPTGNLHRDRIILWSLSARSFSMSYGLYYVLAEAELKRWQYALGLEGVYTEELADLCGINPTLLYTKKTMVKTMRDIAEVLHENAASLGLTPTTNCAWKLVRIEYNLLFYDILLPHSWVYRSHYIPNGSDPPEIYTERYWIACKMPNCVKCSPKPNLSGLRC